MLNSAILDVAIGLIFTFLSVSLAAGAAVEAVSSVLKYRSKTLLTGITALLNDKDFDKLAARLYAHALINPRGPGLFMASTAPAGAAAPDPAPPHPAAHIAAPMALTPADTARLKTDMPAYIDSGQFATALMDVLSLTRNIAGAVPTMTELKATIDAAVPTASNPQLNQLLTGMVVQADGNLQAVRTALCSWFDNAMDRVSGAYKRWTQVWTFVAAAAISVALNADAVTIAQRVWAQPVLISGIKAEHSAQATIDEAAKASVLPFGWTQSSVSSPSVGTAGVRPPLGLSILGWLITALASLFGAPFWFDTLQRVTRLKGAGPSPAEKADNSAAAA